MAFPVDMLDNCSHEELETSAEDYMTDLRCADPDNPEGFSFLNVTVRHSTVTFLNFFLFHLLCVKSVSSFKKIFNRFIFI